MLRPEMTIALPSDAIRRCRPEELQALAYVTAKVGSGWGDLPLEGVAKGIKQSVARLRRILDRLECLGFLETSHGPGQALMVRVVADDDDEPSPFLKAISLSALPPTARLILHTLDMFVDNDGNATAVPVSEISQRSGLVEDEIVVQLRRMRDEGWIAPSLVAAILQADRAPAPLRPWQGTVGLS